MSPSDTKKANFHPQCRLRPTLVRPGGNFSPRPVLPVRAPVALSKQEACRCRVAGGRAEERSRGRLSGGSSPRPGRAWRSRPAPWPASPRTSPAPPPPERDGKPRERRARTGRPCPWRPGPARPSAQRRRCPGGPSRPRTPPRPSPGRPSLRRSPGPRSPRRLPPRRSPLRLLPAWRSAGRRMVKNDTRRSGPAGSGTGNSSSRRSMRLRGLDVAHVVLGLDDARRHEQHELRALLLDVLRAEQAADHRDLGQQRDALQAPAPSCRGSARP